MPADQIQASPSFVGVVVYNIGTDGTLDGVWTTSLSPAGRALGREHLSGGVPGRLAGSYDLQIFDEAGQLILTGTTSISERGPAFALRWNGNDGSSYDGIGIMQRKSVLAASYWPSEDS